MSFYAKSRMLLLTVNLKNNIKTKRMKDRYKYKYKGPIFIINRNP
jgi:hypothetical protein